ncbi:restriction endonuclease subunit S [Pseudomonas sp. C1C7]|uniref:restriction endonuclease subunit S n=1 Tax=Pseudomonas sp. C1C7 TaxID=2735272 RepID=UPI0015860973|nr:restriction endonuclease subunit S [Pseudomonas sp. C1C7]NUT74319.1 restriction endonuclease subunit S [Pseudomonas sp. C1C7]
MTALLTNNLSLLAGAQNGVKKLRELILELAVRGKLVPQDPDDEPASELLMRIAEAKARLVADGLIKKQKPLAEVGEEAEPFELPAGWKWSSLSKVAFVNPRNAAADSLEVSFVPMTFIGTRFDDRHAQEPRLWGEVKQGFTHFAEGDIGVAKITPCFENSKACVFFNLKNGLGAGTTELHIVRPITGTLDPRYVLAYLKSPQFLLVGGTKMTGTAGQKRLPKDFVEANPFPVPPLAEQHRIVAKVDELMALCDRLEAQQAGAESAHAQLVHVLLDSLTQTSDATDFAANWQRLAEHFHTLFTTETSIDALKQTLLQLAVMGKLVPQDPSDASTELLIKKLISKRRSTSKRSEKKETALQAVELIHPFQAPTTWNWVKLGDIYEIQRGSSPRPKGDPRYFSSSPTKNHWIKISDMSSRCLDGVLLSTDEYLTDEGASHSRFVTPSDIIIAVSGSVGKTRKLGISGYIYDGLIAIKSIEDETMKDYLYIYFQVMEADLLGASTGSAWKNINTAIANAMPVPIPPIPEQHRIVAKVDQLMTLCDQLKTRLTQARQLNEQLASTLAEQAVA